MVAVSRDNVAGVRALLDHGADVHARDASGGTALSRARALGWTRSPACSEPPGRGSGAGRDPPRRSPGWRAAPLPRGRHLLLTHGPFRRPKKHGVWERG